MLQSSIRFSAPAKVDVAVVGGGIGGLVAAALLAKAGAKVLLAEQHVVPGGYCHSWVRRVRHKNAVRQFRFDAGPVDISGVHRGGTLACLLDHLGVADQLTWRRLEHTYLVGSALIDVDHDWRAFVRRLSALYPMHAEGIQAFFEAMKTIYDALFSFSPSAADARRPPQNEREWNLFRTKFPMADYWRTCPIKDFVATFVSSGVVQGVLLFLSYYVGDEYSAITVNQMANIFGFYFHGGYYPVGGTGALADALVTSIRQNGGTVLLKAPVHRIRVENGRATGIDLANGIQVEAGSVVSNADLRGTFTTLIEPTLLPDAFRAAIAKNEPTCSGFTVFLGLDYVPDVRSYTVNASNGKLNFSFHVPTRIDPSAAPEGYSVFEVRTLLPNKGMHNWFPTSMSLKEWRRAPEYAARKRYHGERLLNLVEKVVPGLREHIVYRSDASPVTYARYSKTTYGALYGFEKRLVGSETPIQGLYLAGCSNTVAGIEAAAISGGQAAQTILPGLEKKMHAPRGDLVRLP
jgi:all-trans-retinol 13,14-reductase